jgi:hypothetical protein
MGRRRVGKGHRHRTVGGAGARQVVGEAIQAGVQIGDLGGLQQAQVALGQRGVGIPRQGAIPGDAGAQAVLQQAGVAFAAHMVGEHAREGQVRLPGGEAMDQRAEGLGHGLGVDHGHHRHAEEAGDVGPGGAAVKQAHHPLDEDQVGPERRGVQAPGGVGGAAHAQVQVVDRCPAGHRVDLRVEEVRPALEDGHTAPLAGVQAGQGGGDGGLALAGSRRGNKQGGAQGGVVQGAIHRGGTRQDGTAG